MKVIFILIFISMLFGVDTYKLLTDVINGQKEVKISKKITVFNFPTEKEIKGISKEIDKSKYNNYDLISLFCAESGFDKIGVSHKGAEGICQVMPETKKDILTRVLKEKNDSTIQQDVKIAIAVLSEIERLYKLKINHTPNFKQLILAYNAGLGVVLKNNWIHQADKIYIQPKLLIRDYEYYKNNFINGVYDIHCEYIGYRYKAEKFDNIVAYRVNNQFKTIEIDTVKMTMKWGTNKCDIGAGNLINGKTATPKGQYRCIWKIKYCFNEGGPFGAASIRLNYKFKSGASAYIHGTPKPETIKKYETHGCISCYNENIMLIYDYVEIGDFVVIK